MSDFLARVARRASPGGPVARLRPRALFERPVLPRGVQGESLGVDGGPGVVPVTATRSTGAALTSDPEAGERHPEHGYDANPLPDPLAPDRAASPPSTRAATPGIRRATSWARGATPSAAPTWTSPGALTESSRVTPATGDAPARATIGRPGTTIAHQGRRHTPQAPTVHRPDASRTGPAAAPRAPADSAGPSTGDLLTEHVLPALVAAGLLADPDADVLRADTPPAGRLADPTGPSVRVVEEPSRTVDPTGDVHVHIDRVDVLPPAPRERARSRTRPAPVVPVDHDAYLARRRGERS